MSYSKKKVYLIGEIGINHNGDVKLAKKLILMAKNCGFNAVKFQKRTPDICVPESKKNLLRETPWGHITYLEYKKKIELNKKDFDQIDKYCKKLKIDWFCSAWDIESIKFLKSYRSKFNKVASAMLTNLELLQHIARERKTTFISTGMSTYKDIDKAVKIFKKNKCKFILMHSVSTYPCPENKLNLSMIQKLKKKYNCDVGYSGHEVAVGPSVFAIALGASYIERHITLDRTMWGTDQSSSLEYNGMIQLSNLARKFENCIGDGIKKFSKEEKSKLQDQKYW
tara:strand:+ start:22 stop:867 length:846 start_codon:yes stop_codon:yes gene_type:complete